MVMDMTPLRFFFGEHSRHPQEYDQLREIASAVGSSDLEGPVYLVSNFLLANGEVDCLLVMPHGLVVLELKAYQGTIEGVEEGEWRVVTSEGNSVPLRVNLFHQLRALRHDMVRRLFRIHATALSQIDERDLRKVAAWGYFRAGSTYAPGQVERDRVKWFDIVTVDNLVERLHQVHAGFTIGTEEMDAIVRELRVTPANRIQQTEGSSVHLSPPPVGTGDPLALEQALFERMESLVSRIEAIPRAIADIARTGVDCTDPDPGSVAGGCSDKIAPDESTGSLAERIRRFVCTEYVAPARRDGRTEFSVTSGEVHRAMGLSNRMPAVCGALRSRRLEEVCRIELTEEIRSVRVRENSATNRFVYRIRE